MKRRVVITGAGVIAPNADNLPQFLSSLQNGRSGISQVTGFDTSQMRVHIGGEIKSLAPPPPDIDRVSQLALVAAEEAVANANLNADQKKGGVAVGTISSGVLSLEKCLLGGKKDPNLESKLSLEAPAKLISKRLNFNAGALTTSNACAASAVSLALAFDKIRFGKWDVALAGGCESFYLLSYAGFHALRSLDPIACRPFDAERQGLVIGEGAGFLVLESLEQAKSRGANILAEIIGYGLSSDAYHETAPEPGGEGAACAMLSALEDAQISSEDVSYINAHGTGTPHNDKMETRAIHKAFKNVPVSSTKSMIGHLMGAAGAVEAIVSVLALKHSFIPPTINYKTPDPLCDLDYVPNQAREQKLNIVMSSNFGFGGTNAVILFKRFA